MIAVRPISLGASSLGARGAETDVAALADALVASPFGQVDTSNNYADGRSETALGRAIARLGGLPDGSTIFTKVDADRDTRAFDGDRVRRSLDESLARLGLDRLPLLHLHDPFHLTVAEAAAPGGAIEALVSLRDQGIVGAIGIATGTRPLVEEYIRTDLFDAVLTHNRYTLADRSAETILQLAAERGMTVFNAAPFGGGILADAAAERTDYAYRPASYALLGFIGRLRQTCAQWNVELPAAALHFSLRDPRIHSTVVGVSSLERLAALDRLVAARPPDGFFEAIEALGSPPPSAND
jgi:D-threo-aldose 1-dehydrogenase